MLDILYYDGSLKRCDIDNLPLVKHKKIWIDAIDINGEEVNFLANLFRLHEVSKEDIGLSHGRIKIEEFPHYMFCTFYGLEKYGNEVQLIPIEFVIGHNFIITAHKKNFGTYERIKNRKDIVEKLFVKGVSFIFHSLLDEELDNFIPILQEIDEEIESINSSVAIKAKTKELNRLLFLRKKVIEIRRVSLPQREKISFLSRRDYKFLPHHSQPYFRDLYDEAIRIEDKVDSQREMLSSTFEVYMTSINNHMSEIMKVLSIIATIALPLTVISGVYGTNFINLPGSKTPEGFWFMMIIMGIVMIGMILFFKKRKWF